MTRGVALVATAARVTQLTGRAQLENLESDGDLSLPDLLVSASDAIFDRLEADGIDPTKLTNEDRAERVIAWHFLALLAGLGLFSGGEGERSQEFHDRFMALSDKYYAQHFKPRTATGSPARPGTVVPKATNINCSNF